jgi:methylated-DNA-[protein]-cysteine S-methyltransferase
MTKVHTSATDSFVTISSPIGRIEIRSNGNAITGLTIEGTDGNAYGRLPHGGAPGHADKMLTRAIKELEQYFAGKRREFSLPIELHGTDFQKEVWAVIAATPFGETASYGEIAERIGRHGAGRAVGGAVGANPVPIIVGCHRILASNQRITGFSGGSGIPTKKQLLSLEGISYAD